MGDNSDKKKNMGHLIGSPIFFMRNPYMKFLKFAWLVQNLCYASKSVQFENAQNNNGAMHQKVCNLKMPKMTMGP